MSARVPDVGQDALGDVLLAPRAGRRRLGR